MPSRQLMEDPPDPAGESVRAAKQARNAGSVSAPPETGGEAIGKDELSAWRAAVFDSSHDAIITKTLDGKITSWNRGAQRLFGYSEEEAVGQPITLIIPPERHPEEREILARVRRGEEIEHYGTQRVTRDGRVLDIWINVLAVRDGEGRIIGAAKIARDVTERNRNEAALRRRFAHLRILYDLTDTVARASALEEVYDAALDGLESALGAERASILVTDDQGVMRFRASRGLSEGYRAAAEGHSPWSAEAEVIEPVFIRDAREVDLGPLREVIDREGIRALGFFPLLHQGRLLGKFMVYFNSPHDFSEEESRLGQAIAGQIAFAIERKCSEAVLYQREEAFRALAENSPDIIARFDRQFRHVYVNPAITEATGMPASEFIGRTNRELGMPAELCDQWEQAYRAAFEQGKEQLIEFSFPGPDGTRHYYSRVVPELDVEGRVQTALGMTRDITQRKRVEETLRAESAFRKAIETSMPAGVAAVALDGRQIYVNPAFCEMVGWEEHELLGAQAPYAYWPPEELPRITAALDRTLAGHAPPEGFELRFMRRSGERFDVQLALAPLVEGEGQPTGWLASVSDITGRKRAEQQTRESEERLRLATQTGKVGLWDWNIPGNHVTWTDSLYDVHGVTPQEMKPTVEGFAELVHPGDRERVAEAIRRTLEEDAPYELEFRSLRREGEVVWLFTNARVLRENGRPIRLLGATMDITRLKRAEEAARESERRFRMLADSAPVLIWMSGPRKEGRYFNKVWLEFTGRTLEQEMGDGWFASVHPDDLERTAQTCNAAFAARQPFTMQFRMRRADGRWRWLLDTGTPRFEPDGKLAGYIGSCIDITDRIEAEEGLRRGEGLLRAVVETAVDGIITIDERGTVGSFNPAAERIFGYAADEVIGRNVSMLMPEPYHSEHDSYIGNYRRTGERKIIGIGREVKGRRKDGSIFPLDLAVSETEVGDRRIFTGLVRDISDRKQGEEEREHLLASERAARTDAERANRLKDEFLATVSHELRTPLNAIVGWSELLSGKGEDEEVAEGLQVIGRNSHALVRLVEDLLDVGRIISGKMRLDVQRVDLTDVIDAAVRSVEPAAAAKGLRLQKILDPLAGHVTGDPARLQQIVWNLLSNAIKFTPRDGRVQIHLERINSHVEIVVTDTGEGIDPQLLPLLFERFRQADSSTTRRHGGLGIGLALVRHLVEMHGGTVRVKSPGKGMGATFTIALPLRAVEVDDTGPSEAAREHPTTPRRGEESPLVRLEGISVLAIDDEPDTRALVKRFLEQAGATVATAESAESGFALLREDRPDVLLCDIGMPGEDGYSFIRRVRKLRPEEGGNTPAVALTAFARSEDRRRALMSGFQMHLPKPVEPGELLVVIANLVDRFKATREG